jgi:hypothetical protein
MQSIVVRPSKCSKLPFFLLVLENVRELPVCQYIIIIIIISVGPAVPRRMYCSLPRLIVLTPL